jgi:hypothetical protein
MKAKRTVNYGYKCPECQTSFSDEDWTQRRMWIVADCYSSECSECGEYHFTEEPTEVMGWECGDNCIMCQSSEPDFVEMWRCGECETDYADKEEAGECCQ